MNEVAYGFLKILGFNIDSVNCKFFIFDKKLGKLCLTDNFSCLCTFESIFSVNLSDLQQSFLCDFPNADRLKNRTLSRQQYSFGL